MKLTEARIKKLISQGASDRFIVDDQTPGLYLRIREGRSPAWYWIRTVDGRKKREQLGTIKQLNLECARVMIRRKGAALQASGAPTFHAMALQYLAYRPGKPGTLKAKQGLLKRASPFIGNKRITEITRADIDLVHQTIAEAAPFQANRVCEFIRAVMNLAVRWELIERNPALGFKRAKEPRRTRRLSKDEMLRFLRALGLESNDAAADCLLLLICTGQRPKEVKTLTWDQVFLDHKVLSFQDSKSEAARLIHLNDIALAMLESRKQVSTSTWVFPSPKDSGPIKDMRKPFWRICRNAGIKGARIYDLRRTFGSLLADSGCSVLAIRDAYGHKDIRTTQIYLHLDAFGAKQAVEQAGAIISACISG